jgi:hypothetical protein
VNRDADNKTNQGADSKSSTAVDTTTSTAVNYGGSGNVRSAKESSDTASVTEKEKEEEDKKLPAIDKKIKGTQKKETSKYFIKTNPNHKQGGLVVDILSMASLSRLHYVEAQSILFSSHPLVRNLFNITELDDLDTECSSKLTKQDLFDISEFCRSDDRHSNVLTKHFAQWYAQPAWLEKQSNPVGWMCAQPRFVVGLQKVLQHYRDTRMELPDYFIMMDDDTYINMDLFDKQFVTQESNEPIVTAGCMVRWPVMMGKSTLAAVLWKTEILTFSL